MIDRAHVSEISGFLGHFTDTFKKGVRRCCGPDTVIGSSAECSYVQEIFKISGVIQGYIAAKICKKSDQVLLPTKTVCNKQCQEQLIRFFKDSSVAASFPGYNIDTERSADSDTFLYGVRKREPVMSMRIQEGAFTVELYVLQITDSNFSA